MDHQKKFSPCWRKGNIANRPGSAVPDNEAMMNSRTEGYLYLLGFGPRTGQAIADLALLLHPELGS